MSDLGETWGVIYKHTCKISGKSYVGKTTRTMKGRWDEHIEEALGEKYDTKFHRAIRKYGPENFTHEILKTCPEVELNMWEIAYIEEYDTYHTGYNMTKGGDGGAMCQESIEKMINSLVERCIKKNGYPGCIEVAGKKFGAKYRTKRIGTFATKEDAINATWAKHRGEEVKNRVIVPEGNVQPVGNKWQAVGPKSVYLGMYDTEEEGRRACVEYKNDPENFRRPNGKKVKLPSSCMNRISMYVNGKFIARYNTKEDRETAREKLLNDPEGFRRPDGTPLPANKLSIITEWLKNKT